MNTLIGTVNPHTKKGGKLNSPPPYRKITEIYLLFFHVKFI